MHKSTFTSFQGNIAILSQSLRSYGLDPKIVLKDFYSQESEHYDITQRVSIELIDQLFDLCLNATKDNAFGLRCSEFILPASYHALSMGLSCSHNLREFCQRLVRYFSLITTSRDIQFHCDTKQPFISLKFLHTNISPETSRVHIDASAAIIFQLFKMAYGPYFKFERVVLEGDIIATSPEQSMSIYQSFFNAPISFLGAETRLYLPADELDLRLPAANSVLANQNDTVINQALKTIVQKLSVQVENA